MNIKVSGDNMKWHSWIGIVLMIGGGFSWMVIPNKSILYHIVTIGIIVIGWLIVKYIPDSKLEFGE